MVTYILDWQEIEIQGWYVSHKHIIAVYNIVDIAATGDCMNGRDCSFAYETFPWWVIVSLYLG